MGTEQLSTEFYSFTQYWIKVETDSRNEVFRPNIVMHYKEMKKSVKAYFGGFATARFVEINIIIKLNIISIKILLSHVVSLYL